MVEKIKTGRANWSPATLEEVTEDIVNGLFDLNSPHLKSVPEFQHPFVTQDPRDYTEFALPTEKEIRDMVTGEHPQGGDTGVTLKELVSLFESIRDGKMGVHEKVKEVATRKCELIDNSDGNRVWLKWIHSPQLP